MSGIRAVAGVQAAGAFATCRRGGLTNAEVRELLAHRSRPRPTPWQALAAMYGRPLSTLQAVVQAPITPSTPVPVLTAEETRITELWNEGLALDRICAEVKTGLTRLKKIAKRLELTPRRKAGTDWTPEQDQAIWTRHVLGGVKAHAVAAQLDLTCGQVQRRAAVLVEKSRAGRAPANRLAA